MTAPCKRRPFVLYDKAKLSEFYLQEENLEKIIAEMAVTGVRFYSQFFLRHAVGLAQVLGLYSIHFFFRILRPFFGDDGKVGAAPTTDQ